MFIEDERSRIYILNFFTTKQIVQLQSELFKVSKSLKAVQHILLPLISLINEDCNIKMIKEVVDKEIMTGKIMIMKMRFMKFKIFYIYKYFIFYILKNKLSK